MYQIELDSLQVEVLQELLKSDKRFKKYYKNRISDILSNARILKPLCPFFIIVPSISDGGAFFFVPISSFRYVED